MKEKLEELLKDHKTNLQVMDVIAIESFKLLYECLLEDLIEIVEEEDGEEW